MSETNRRAKDTKRTRTDGCLRAAEDLAASCFLGALPPVDLRAVCLVRAIDAVGSGWVGWCGVSGWVVVVARPV